MARPLQYALVGSFHLPLMGMSSAHVSLIGRLRCNGYALFALVSGSVARDLGGALAI